jgi:DNA-directed RNA polymerase subunit beta'
VYRDEYDLPKKAEVLVQDGQEIEAGAVLARPPAPKTKAKSKTKGQVEEKEPEQELATGEIVARTSGQVSIEKGRIVILFVERDFREYPIRPGDRLKVHDGDYIHAGQALTEGPLNPQDILRIQGPEAVQMYLVEEVQKVYRNQGVTINDKHIETIVRQMLRRVRIDNPGDSAMLPGELVDRFLFESKNAAVLAEGGEPATAQPVLLGVTKASLNTESFLAAASFQETTRVLTEAAISGQVDRLLGLKENVIIGKLIPARATIDLPPVLPPIVEEVALPPGFGDEDGGGLGLEDWPEPDGDEIDESPEDEGLLSGLRSLMGSDVDTTEPAAEVGEPSLDAEQDGEGLGAEDLLQAADEAPEEE